MRKSLFHLIIFCMVICLFPGLILAKTGYVSDMLMLTFRMGPGGSYDVIKTLKSNTPVTILKEENGFYKVELLSNEIGWVDKNFIIFEPPKTLIIEQLKRENQALVNKISKLESTTGMLKEKNASTENDFSQKIKSLEASLKTALDEKAKVNNLLTDNTRKYNTLIEQSKNIQDIIKDNKLFEEKNETLSKELETLQEKNKNQFKTGMIKWFLAGGLVLLLGWIIGQSVSSKKRRTGSLLD